MSRIGKLPVAIPTGVSVEIADMQITVNGKVGELSQVFSNDVTVVVEGDKVLVKPSNASSKAKAMWGLYRSLINNMVKGASVGFVKKMEINGVGYRAAAEGKLLTLFLGYSHEIKYAIPADITIICEKPTLLVVSGASKQRVGQVCAEIRALRKPEPYKGKGIKYENEVIIRKVGKKK